VQKNAGFASLNLVHGVWVSWVLLHQALRLAMAMQALVMAVVR